MLSSSGERLGVAETRNKGFAASLTKPVRQSELYDCLMTSLRHEDLSGFEVNAPSRGPAPEAGEVRGSILLVEDNKVNQLVGSKVLAKLGYHFDVASHGGEAVQAVMLNSYDAILMDCQMPEMDGYEATAHIRRWEGDSRHTPIIAMTAAAMEGDREKCLASGMDDYITKPVRPEVIAAVIERWLRATSFSRALAPPVQVPVVAKRVPGVSVDAEATILDSNQIGLLRDLDDGEGGVLAELVAQYVEESQIQHQALVKALGARDAHAIERAAHSLRGASANLGGVAVAGVCGEIESRGRADDVAGCVALKDRFQFEFDRLRSALEHLVVRA